MGRSFNSLVAVVFSSGFAFSAYPILSNTHSQSAQPYTIASDPIGGGPRMPISGASTGASRLTTFDNEQIN